MLFPDLNRFCLSLSSSHRLALLHRSLLDTRFFWIDDLETATELYRTSNYIACHYLLMNI